MTTRAAFERLRIAMIDAGQWCGVANFILTWRNADSLGGVDLSDIYRCRSRYLERRVGS
ncbi:hypothetical protein ABIF65_011328 [Bradyrhizobium japonicum]